MNEVAFLDALRGVVAVLVTPYDKSGAVDEAKSTQLAERADAGGVHVVTALGNTSELYQLTAAERRVVLRSVATGTSRARLLAGFAGAAIEIHDESQYAADLGYHAVMIHEPMDPFGDGDGLLRFYREVAERSALPIVLYLRSTRLSLEQIRELVTHPKILGGKFARADFGTLEQLVHDGDSVWVNGAAESKIAITAAMGITGFTSGIAAARPDAALAMHAAVCRGDLNRLTQLMRLIAPVERMRAANHARSNVDVVKEMLRIDGIEFGSVRPPHVQLSAQERLHLRDLLDRWPARFDDSAGTNG
ncbi:dihydrodipicolinate synthase family protein [Microbacterium esteraromaticum]|uniref:Dihydrodipicolinate synthase family protein n=1 Tax=Microbacterium esteraromaticum TaxID=57043 RepID=A0A7D8AI05_9MICO|nr:dihydrodipicolinate synthase family protein [Microbacterium esteraromaticum]QMU96465.1 dihydrodipicolinate synthase family protein [Microbacterium esteraromaticum]